MTEAGTVRLWRPAGHERILLMQGRTASYAAEPSGEYFIGVIDHVAMRGFRGGQRWLLRPGELIVWDPSGAHRGAPGDGRTPWSCRLMIIEAPDVSRALEVDVPEPHFPQPVVRDRCLAARFMTLHREFDAPAAALERDVALVTWLHDLAGLAPSTPRRAARRRAARDDPALRSACEYLQDHLADNPTLADLAGAAGVSPFRLIRLFADGLGVAPHRFQVAQRVRRARRLLERGESIAYAAAATGFADQSHLHRHFRRSLGMTPGEYVGRLAGGRS